MIIENYVGVMIDGIISCAVLKLHHGDMTIRKYVEYEIECDRNLQYLILDLCNMP